MICSAVERCLRIAPQLSEQLVKAQMEHREALFDCLNSQSHGKMGLADTWRTSDEYRFGVADPGAGGQGAMRVRSVWRVFLPYASMSLQSSSPNLFPTLNRKPPSSQNPRKLELTWKTRLSGNCWICTSYPSHPFIRNPTSQARGS